MKRLIWMIAALFLFSVSAEAMGRKSADRLPICNAKNFGKFYSVMNAEGTGSCVEADEAPFYASLCLCGLDDEAEYAWLGVGAGDLSGYVTNEDLTTALADYAELAGAAFTGPVSFAVATRIIPSESGSTTCDAGAAGLVYFDTSDAELCYCNGTAWGPIDAASAADCESPE